MKKSSRVLVRLTSPSPRLESFSAPLRISCKAVRGVGRWTPGRNAGSIFGAREGKNKTKKKGET